MLKIYSKDKNSIAILVLKQKVSFCDLMKMST